MSSENSNADIYGSTELEHLALIGEFDAQVWARTFVETVQAIPEIPTDQDTMLAWFASAIMAGYDHARNPLADAIQAMLNELGVPGVGYPAPVANAVEIGRAALGLSEATSV